MANAIIIRDVSFQLPNATGNFTITDTGGPAGLTPKAVIIVLSGASSLLTITSHARMSIGMYDGTTSLAGSFMAENSVIAANADTGRRRATDKILNLTVTTTQALGVGATAVSLGTNALTINVDTASLLRGFVRFFYGADLQAKVVSFTGNATVDLTADSPSLGFQADAVIAMSLRNAWAVDVGLDNAFFSVGCAGRLSASTQACVGIAAEDRESNTSVGSKPRADRLLSILESVAGVVAEVASIELTTWGSDTITVTTRNGSEGLGIGLLALRLNGEKCHADCPVLNSDTAGVASYTTPGFTPRAVMLVGQQAPTVGTISSTVAGFSFGGAVSGNLGVSAGWNDEDNVTDSRAQSFVASGRMLSIPREAETLWACELSAMTRLGFDYNVIDTHTGDLPTVVFSIGEQPSDTGWLAEARSGSRWRRRLARM